MSEYAEQYRTEMRAKAQRLGSPPPAKKGENKTDASDWVPEEPLKANVQTGARPVSRQVFRAGGMVRGEPAKSHAGRKPRASGGASFADAYVNRDVKAANRLRDGEKHDGGFKTGGKVEPVIGGSKKLKQIRGVIPEKARLSAVPKKGAGLPDEHDDLKGRMTQNDRSEGPRKGKKAGGSLDGQIQGTRPTGGRLARKSGGKAKDKMNVNIIIAQPKQGGPAMPPAGMGAPPPGVPAPPPQMPQGAAPMGSAAGAGAPAPMGRKSGGRTSYPIDSGAGGGLGRLEKAKAYG